MPSADRPHLPEHRPAAPDEVVPARQAAERSDSAGDVVRDGPATARPSGWLRRRFVIPTAPPRV